MIGFKYPEPESTEFLIRVLEALEISYALQRDEDSITVFWAPASSEQEREVDNRVSQHLFIRKACPSLQLPLPSEPAKAELSC